MINLAKRVYCGEELLLEGRGGLSTSSRLFIIIIIIIQYLLSLYTCLTHPSIVFFHPLGHIYQLRTPVSFVHQGEGDKDLSFLP